MYKSRTEQETADIEDKRESVNENEKQGGEERTQRTPQTERTERTERTDQPNERTNERRKHRYCQMSRTSSEGSVLTPPAPEGSFDLWERVRGAGGFEAGAGAERFAKRSQNE